MIKNFFLGLVLLMGLFPLRGHCRSYVAGIAAFPFFQAPASEHAVKGIRFSLFWGSHDRMRGFDFGILGNHTARDHKGFSIAGIMNYTGGATIAGMQLAGLMNINRLSSKGVGLQLSGIANYNAARMDFVGIQASLMNANARGYIIGIQAALLANLRIEDTKIYGIQFAAVNDAFQAVGFQIGIYNRAERVYGFQIGIVNQVVDLHGLQLGILNFNRNGLFRFFPIINVGF